MPLASTNIVSSRKHTDQSDASYTNLDTDSSHKNSLHLLQTTTSNIKAKQKLTCDVTSPFIHFLFQNVLHVGLSAVTIYTQHTFGDTVLSEGAQYDLSTTVLETFRIRI